MLLISIHYQLLTLETTTESFKTTRRHKTNGEDANRHGRLITVLLYIMRLNSLTQRRRLPPRTCLMRLDRSIITQCAKWHSGSKINQTMSDRRMKSIWLPGRIITIKTKGTKVVSATTNHLHPSTTRHHSMALNRTSADSKNRQPFQRQPGDDTPWRLEWT